MSWRALTWAVDVEGLDVVEYAVLVRLANHMNETTGLCNPSQSRLAKAIGRSHDTVARAVASLVNKGLLTVSRGDGRRSTIYSFPAIPSSVDNSLRVRTGAYPGYAKSGLRVRTGAYLNKEVKLGTKLDVCPVHRLPTPTGGCAACEAEV